MCRPWHPRWHLATLRLGGMADLGELTRRFVEDVWNGAREETAYELVDPDCGNLGGGSGPDSALAFHRERRMSFPDQRYEIMDMVVGADSVAVRWRATGTQLGAFGPVTPTGQQVDYEGATFMRFAAGRIVANWSVNELAKVLQQLGVELVPPTPQVSR